MTTTMALAQMTPFSGNHPHEAEKLASHAPAGQAMTIKVIFALRNQAALKLLLADLIIPGKQHMTSAHPLAQLRSDCG